MEGVTRVYPPSLLSCPHFHLVQLLQYQLDFTTGRYGVAYRGSHTENKTSTIKPVRQREVVFMIRRLVSEEYQSISLSTPSREVLWGYGTDSSLHNSSSMSRPECLGVAVLYIMQPSQRHPLPPRSSVKLGGPVLHAKTVQLTPPLQFSLQ